MSTANQLSAFALFLLLGTGCDDEVKYTSQPDRVPARWSGVNAQAFIFGDSSNQTAACQMARRLGGECTREAGLRPLSGVVFSVEKWNDELLPTMIFSGSDASGACQAWRDDWRSQVPDARTKCAPR